MFLVFNVFAVEDAFFLKEIGGQVDGSAFDFLCFCGEDDRAIGVNDATARNFLRVLELLEEMEHLIVTIAEHDTLKVFVDESRTDDILGLGALPPPFTLDAVHEERVDGNHHRHRHANGCENFCR